MTVIDLNLILDSGHFTLPSVKGMADEHRTNRLCADNGFSAAQRIPQKGVSPYLQLPLYVVKFWLSIILDEPFISHWLHRDCLLQ